MLSPQDDRSTAAVQASLTGSRTAGGTAPSRDRSPEATDRTAADTSARAHRTTTDRFRRTSDRAFLGLVAELARTDRAS